LLEPRGDIAELPLEECLAMTRERFAEVFRGTPIRRAKWEGFLRNACVVAGNIGGAECRGALEKLLGHESAVVRGTAAWALGRLGERGGAA
jgi:epoxyqueuosine reductase